MELSCQGREWLELETEMNWRDRVQFKVRQVMGEDLDVCCPEGTLEIGHFSKGAAAGGKVGKT